MSTKIGQTAKDRFLSKIKIDEVGCWIWIGSRNKHGYGIFALPGKVVSAHRAAYLLFIAPIPDGQVVRHRCDIRTCVNPVHLLLGTVKDNNVDTVVRGNSTRKLTSAQAEMVLRSRSLGSSFLADLLNVSRSTIRRIWKGESYKQRGGAR